MTVHIEFMFSCVLALASVYAASTTQCFEQNIHYIGIGLHKSKNYGSTGSAEGCQSLCQQTDGCDWFNWEGKVDKCWLKTGKGNQSRQKPGGVTGPRICPTTTRKPIITTTTSIITATASRTPTSTATTRTTTTINHIGTTYCFEENIHYIGHPLNKQGGDNNYGPTGSAEGCQSLCQQKDGCGWFNWEGEEDECWLKSGKGNQNEQKPGGVTGPRICPGPELLHIGSQYSYYKVPVRPGSALLSSVIEETCEMHNMTPQCYINNLNFTDSNCITAPNGKHPSNELAKIICGKSKGSLFRFPDCPMLENTFWYMLGWEAGSAVGFNQGEYEKGKDIITSSDNQYFAACLTAEPVFLHVDSQYSYYKVPVRPGSALLSSVIQETCEMHNMTPQCYINKLKFTDSNCIMAPNGKYPSNELAEIICGKSMRSPVRCPMLEHTFWYMRGWEAGSAWGVNQGQYERGKDIITSSDNQYFAACLTAGLELLHVGSQYSYYKVPVRPGSALLSSVIKRTCEMHGMTPQCFDDSSQHTDSNCIMAPTEYPMFELAEIICGIEDPWMCHTLEHTFWYVKAGAAWGVNQGQLAEGKDITTSKDNQYFAACLQLKTDENW